LGTARKDVEEVLMWFVDLLTAEAIKAISDGARPIPPPNMDAESPAEVRLIIFSRRLMIYLSLFRLTLDMYILFIRFVLLLSDLAVFRASTTAFPLLAINRTSRTNSSIFLFPISFTSLPPNLSPCPSQPSFVPSTIPALPFPFPAFRSTSMPAPPPLTPLYFIPSTPSPCPFPLPQAYSLKDIISPSSKSALKPFLEQLAACEGDRDRIKLLPFSHSDWVNKRLKELNSANKPNKEKLFVPLTSSSLFFIERPGFSPRIRCCELLCGA
jgi:hypothetical protein